jgi:hypothetical protein
MYGRDAFFAGWITPFTGHVPFECLSCGWRGWCVPPDGDPTVVSAVASFVSLRAPSMVQRLVALKSRLTRLRLPVNSAALKGAALLGVLAGIIAALIALSAAATLSQTVADDVPPPPRIESAPTASPSAPQPTPEAVSVALPSPTPEPPALAAAPTASANGITESAPAPTAPRPQTTAPARIAGYRGGLQVDSEPDGARVFIDGEEVGVTPLEMKSLAVGSRVVRVEAEGYQTWSAAARVVANQRARVSAVLQRSSQR